ncbi:hypothetical protein [Pseudomonas sp. TUM22785]|uniref:hypothetical protein n=1 Tax=Pseudomonas sp. TUM22785 TaxID=3019098 RepID=UPI0023063EB6|nr:hypothetical protein [Pseudomonas sp. TUM22785]WCD78489.1 hypothetical protein PI990_21110 [Pseudomonas sp. TUM22785]
MYAKRQSLKSATALGSTLLISLISVSGCAPLQQAPLAYTSAQVVGVKLGIAPTQPETLEAVVGVKILDAAYAPVAVSNPGLKDAASSGKPFNENLYAIKEIYGIYGSQASADTAAKLLTADESEDMKKFLEAQTALSKAKDATKNAEAAKLSTENALVSVKDLNDLVTPINGCQPIVGNESISSGLTRLSTCADGAAKEIGERYGIILKDQINQKPDDLKKQVTPLTQSLEAAQKSEIDAAKSVSSSEAKVKGALEKLANIQKRDAISVYGSFNSDSKAGSKSEPTDPNATKNSGVDVRIGKVFSTGVAAQNISEAQKLVAGSAALDVCLQNVPRMTAVLPEASKADMTKELLKLCADKIMPSATQQK